LREKVVLPELKDIEIYPRRVPKMTRAQGYEPYRPDEDMVPNVADFGQGYHIHVTGLIHDETGFPSGSPKVTEDAIRRMHEKIMHVQDEITHFEEFFMEDAEYAVVAYGGTARTAYEAVRTARAQGLKVGMVRLMTIWPFADKIIKKTAKQVKAILVPELNYGQLVGEVERAAGGNARVKLLAKYNTEIFTPQELVNAIENLCAGVDE